MGVNGEGVSVVEKKLRDADRQIAKHGSMGKI